MYTNGLKDRFGSPLISLKQGDERYVMMNQIEFEHDKLEEKITLLDRHVQRNADDITKTNDRLHNINVAVKNHIDDQNAHFTEGEKEKFNNLFVRLDGVEEFTKETIPYSETTGINGGEAFRMSARMLPVGEVIDTIIVPTTNTPSGSFYLGVYKILSTEDVNSTNKTLVAISDEPISWTNGGEAIWSFENTPFEIQEGFDLEIHIARAKEDFSATGTTFRANNNNELNCRYKNNATGYGACRYQNGWYSNRAIRVIFKRKGIQGHIGDDTHLTPDEKTEVQNLVNDVYLTVEDAANTYATKEKFEEALGYSYKISEDANTQHDVNAINIISSKLPHNIVFDEIRIPAENTPQNQYYLAIWSVINGRKTSLGHSDEAVRWEAGKDAVWSFKNSPFVIPDNANLEIFLAATLEDILESSANVPSENIRCRYISGNRNESGSVRMSNSTSSWWEFSRNTFVILNKNEHIGDETHLSEKQREVLNEIISNGFVAKNQFDILLENAKQKQQYYDTWTNQQTNDNLEATDCYSFQFAKSDFVNGRIDRIEFPYISGNNAEGFLCVQFFDGSNNVIGTYYSNNKQKQDKIGTWSLGICQFEFNTFETPEDYSFVRCSIVKYNQTTPTGNSGISFRIRTIKRNNTLTWNTNENTRINNTGNRHTTLVFVLTRKYAKNTGITVRNYDWTPDMFSQISVSLAAGGTSFVAPVNGWIISKSSDTTGGSANLYLNGLEIGGSSNSSQVDLQILLRKGDYIDADRAYKLKFIPCKSEQFDYRLENTHTKYDIWKGAIKYDENGESSVQDLYIPNASAWKNEVGHEVIGRISTIDGEQAYDSNGHVLFNIQSQYIENGNYMFVQSSITSFNASLDALTSGAQMFAGARLTSWNTNLPSLTSGETMFYACPSLTSFSADVHSMTSGWNMFMNCSNLTTVSFVNGLGALNDGTGMFKGCSLSYTSLNNILNALPARNGNVIEITVADSVKDDMLNAERWQGRTIPAHNSGSHYLFRHNGWEVRLTSRTGFRVVNESEYDISEANGNTQVTGEWYLNVAHPAGLNIVRVIDGIAYDE